MKIHLRKCRVSDRITRPQFDGPASNHPNEEEDDAPTVSKKLTGYASPDDNQRSNGDGHTRS